MVVAYTRGTGVGRSQDGDISTLCSAGGSSALTPVAQEKEGLTGGESRKARVKEGGVGGGY